MNKGPITTARYLPLILSVIFIGTSGPLGRLIHYSPIAIISLRCLIGLCTLLILIKWQGISLKIVNKQQRNMILGSGLLLAGHWVAYFYSLQLSSVALAMLSMFTYPVITVLLEPFYLKRKFRLVQIPLAVVALAGIYIILPSVNLKNEHTLGILIGVGSAFLFAARNLVIKKHAKGVNGLVLIAHQLAIVIAVTAPFLFFTPVTFHQVTREWYYLLFLGIVTTAMGHTYYIKSLEYFSVSTVSLLSNFTPVVGIILALFLLNEKPSVNILVGGALILFTAIAEVWLSGRNKDVIIEGLD